MIVGGKEGGRRGRRAGEIEAVLGFSMSILEADKKAVIETWVHGSLLGIGIEGGAGFDICGFSIESFGASK